MPVKIKEFNSQFEITTQTIIFINNFNDLELFNDKVKVKIKYEMPLKILIYCENIKMEELSELNTLLVVTSYLNFLIIDDDGVALYTFENLENIMICHETQRIVKINEFDVDSHEWMEKPIFPKKYQNFHGCMMNLGVHNLSSFETFAIKENGVEIFGLSINIISMVSRVLNFTLNFDPCVDWLCKKSHYSCDIYNVIQTTSLDGFAIGNNTNAHWQHVMLNVEASAKFLIPPGDLYTSFEKMWLPFDAETWTCIGVTFIVSMVVIFIVNRCSKRVRDVIFGRGVKTPMLNVFHAFFGDAQTRLPETNFSRFILIIFVYICLVVRTAYQGKLFEFITTAMRKPEIQTLEELREENFTLYLANYYEEFRHTKIIMDIVGLPTKFVTFDDYNTIYTSNLSDPSFRGTILTTEFDVHFFNYYSKQQLIPRFIQKSIGKSYYAIGFVYHNLWNERFNEIIPRFIEAGFVNHIINDYQKSELNQVKKETVGSEKIVLNMEHLGFGFRLCFFVSYLAFLTFLGELLVNWIKNYLLVDRRMKNQYKDVKIIEVSMRNKKLSVKRNKSSKESQIKAKSSENLTNLMDLTNLNHKNIIRYSVSANLCHERAAMSVKSQKSLRSLKNSKSREDLSIYGSFLSLKSVNNENSMSLTNLFIESECKSQLNDNKINLNDEDSKIDQQDDVQSVSSLSVESMNSISSSIFTVYEEKLERE